jgi:nucleotide-binding universal stress UspA family protein
MEVAMLPIRAILHPTDFTDRSDYAFRVACSLARDYGARLLVLHVMPEPMVVYGGGVIPPNPHQQQGELWDQLCKLPGRDPEVPVEPCLGQGDPADTILRVAQQTRCDMIVMATHGRRGVGRFLMGSVAEQVLRRAPCPVVTVKQPAADAHAAAGKDAADAAVAKT